MADLGGAAVIQETIARQSYYGIRTGERLDNNGRMIGQGSQE